MRWRQGPASAEHDTEATSKGSPAEELSVTLKYTASMAHDTMPRKKGTIGSMRATKPGSDTEGLRTKPKNTQFSCVPGVELRMWCMSMANAATTIT